MTAANTPITSAAELPSWPAPPKSGALVVAAAVGAADAELAKLLEEVAVICCVEAGTRLVLLVADNVAELYMLGTISVLW